MNKMISTLSSLLMALAIIFVGVAPRTIRLVDASNNPVFTNPNDFYAILGLEKTCTLKEIKSAKRKLARIYHPDKVQGEAQKAYATTIFIIIDQASDVLSDPKKREEYDKTFKSAFDASGKKQDPPGFRPSASETPSASSRYAAAFEILEQFLTAVKTGPEAVIDFIVPFVAVCICFFAILSWLRWCMGKWAFNALTFSIFASLRLVWWVIRKILTLVCMAVVAVIFASLRLVWCAIRSLVGMAVVAVCRAAVAGATGAVKVVVCLSKGMQSAVRVRDLGSVVAPVPVACNEATVLRQPVAVEAAPALEIEAVHAPVVSEVPAKQARAKPMVPKGGVVPPKPSSRRVRPAPKPLIVNAPLRRSKRIAERNTKRIA
jgi:DnaJ domain